MPEKAKPGLLGNLERALFGAKNVFQKMKGMTKNSMERMHGMHKQINKGLLRTRKRGNDAIHFNSRP